MFQMVFLFALGFFQQALAEDIQVKKAERVQLRRKLQRLSKRNAWSGVDESYRRLKALGIESMTYSDHIQGALASRELGDLQSLIARLELAVKKNPDAEEKSWLSSIQSQCSSVKIRNQRRYKYKLIIEEAPFEMEYNKAIALAEKALQSEGRYNGYLPNGRYAFGSQVFDVQMGVSTNIVISGGGSDESHIYLPVSLGVVHMTSGEGVNPPKALTAPELLIGGGYQLSFGNWVFNEELSFVGVYNSGSWMTLGKLSSSIGWQFPLLTPYVGFDTNLGYIYRQGIVLTDPSEICDCEDVAERAVNYAKAGLILATGPHIGLRYDLTTKIAIDLRLGSRTDSSRWYYTGFTSVHFNLGK